MSLAKKKSVRQKLHDLPEEDRNRIVEIAFFLCIDAANNRKKFISRDQMVAARKLGNPTPARSVSVDRVAINQLREIFDRFKLPWLKYNRLYGKATFRRKYFTRVQQANGLGVYQKNDHQYVRSEEWVWEQDS